MTIILLAILFSMPSLTYADIFTNQTQKSHKLATYVSQPTGHDYRELCRQNVSGMYLGIQDKILNCQRKTAHLERLLDKTAHKVAKNAETLERYNTDALTIHTTSLFERREDLELQQARLRDGLAEYKKNLAEEKALLTSLNDQRTAFTQATAELFRPHLEEVHPLVAKQPNLLYVIDCKGAFCPLSPGEALQLKKIFPVGKVPEACQKYIEESEHYLR